MEILRESIAIGLFLVSIIKLQEKKLLQYILFSFAAFLFHLFAVIPIILFIFFFVLKIPLKLKVLVCVTITILLAIMENPIFTITSFPIIFNYFCLTNYIVDTHLSFKGTLYHFLRIVPILVLVLNKDWKPATLRFQWNFFRNVCMVYIVLVSIRVSSIPFAERIINYFLIPIICIYTAAVFSFVAKIKLESIRFLTFFALSFFVCIYNLIPLLMPDPKCNGIPSYFRYYPYSSIFSKE
jgi:hypothetical protein